MFLKKENVKFILEALIQRSDIRYIGKIKNVASSKFHRLSNVRKMAFLKKWYSKLIWHDLKK